MKNKKQMAYVEVDSKKSKELLNQLKLSFKYNMFNTFSDNSSIDDKIMALSDEEFLSMTNIYKTRLDFFNNLMIAEDYIDAGKDIPSQLWIALSQVRQDYLNYIQS